MLLKYRLKKKKEKEEIRKKKKIKKKKEEEEIRKIKNIKKYIIIYNNIKKHFNNEF